MIVNGETRPIEPGSSISALLEQLGLADRRVAVEVNGEIIPRSEHPRHQLAADDRVEVVQAIGGG